MSNREQIVEMEPMTNRGRKTLGDNEASGSKHLKVIAVVVVAAVIVIAIALGLYFGLPKGQTDPDTEDTEAKNSCSGDGFERVSFAAGGKSKFLKYKFVEANAFPDVREECRSQNAELWEVINGETEWNALFQKAEAAGKPDLWLNGDVVGSCPGSSYFCMEDEAPNGRGLAVRWPSSITASYSRLYKGASTEKSCVVVEKSDKSLWVTEYCNINHYGMCVKRNCIPE